MEVLTVTTLFSVLFAILFLVLFLRARQKSESCAEQDSLIPFRQFESPPMNPAKQNVQDDSHNL